ncbi:hypothetical protein [Hallerella succinigenes]|uniref:hypothetical protein n=1 Tax=Hallerella succinigenes TaxID=1896222 RepID=UPI002A7EB287|nr:hypothetical protein [Hallerella succinigenes]MDY5030169.1 hypothetical protein [Hallerella succinigenes]
MDAKRVLLGVDFSEYSVNVILESKYVFRANVANGLEGGSFRLFLDGKAITDTIAVPQTGILTNS